MSQGTATTVGQTPGDCKVVQCDGAGSTETANDDTDTPNDGNVCTTDSCVGGVETFTPVTPATPCGTNLFCDASGICAGCTQPSECMGTTDTCQHPTCTTGTCGTFFAGQGTLAGTQMSGDCKKSQCNGIGAIEVVNDDADVPVDGNQCTNDVCTNGAPSNPNALPAAPCNQNGGSKCNGSGSCVACIVAADCGTNTACATFQCNGGSCSEMSTAGGTVIFQQTTGDCKQNQCDGSGNIVPVPFITDLPVDGNPCTDDVCTGPVPSNPPSGAGTICPGGQCDGGGACVACLHDSDCGTATACKSFTCTAAHTCQENDVPTGIAAGTQTPGDCHQAQCDGLGNPTNAIDDTDTPNDGIDCTSDVCTGGVPTNPPAGINTSCNQSSGHFCDGAGACVECNIGAQCASLDCALHVCAAATCVDSIKNQDETDIDCGGLICGKCGTSAHCNGAGDCTSGICTGGFCEGSPQVISTSPSDAQAQVSAATTISITFSEAMNAATLTTKTTLDAGACSGTVQVSTDNFTTCVPLTSLVMSVDQKTATWTPAPALSYGETFKIRVATGAESLSAFFLGSTFTTPAGFTTGFSFDPTGTDGSVVVAEVYGGGGNSGSTYKNDFIVLHNRGTTAFDLTNYAVQYAGSSSSTWATTPLSGSIAPGGYFLIQEAAGMGGTTSLPTPDIIGTIAIGATAGKVALTSSTTALTTACPTGPTVVSSVVFGTGSTCTAPAPAAANTTSTQRGNGGCTVTGSNATEFSSAAPNPRSSTTTSAAACVPVANETGISGEADYCTVQFPASLTVQTGNASDTVYCRVYEATVTDPAGPPATFTMELGYGPRDKNPESESGWTWTPMTYNVQVGNDDEFMATFTPSVAAGDYAYACRAIHVSGTVTYCDGDGAGSNAGLAFETPRESDLTVTP